MATEVVGKTTVRRSPKKLRADSCGDGTGRVDASVAHFEVVSEDLQRRRGDRGGGGADLDNRRRTGPSCPLPAFVSVLRRALEAM